MTEAEFTAIVEQNMGRFVGIVARYLKLQAADAEDVTQCSLLKAWTKVEIIRNTGEAEKWLITCAINEGLNYVIARRRYHARLVKAGVIKTMRPSLY